MPAKLYEKADSLTHARVRWNCGNRSGRQGQNGTPSTCTRLTVHGRACCSAVPCGMEDSEKVGKGARHTQSAPNQQGWGCGTVNLQPASCVNGANTHEHAVPLVPGNLQRNASKHVRVRSTQDACKLFWLLCRSNIIILLSKSIYRT